MRLWAFDNLRLASILVVVLFHAMLTYNAGVPWWYVVDSGGVTRYSLFLSTIDVFLMATMFFVSGFFTAKSFISRPIDRYYVKARAQRLLLPGYLQLLLLCPLVFVFSNNSMIDGTSIGTAYWNVWISFFSFDLGKVEPGSYAFAHHIWFVEILFIVTVLFALSWKFWRRVLVAKADGFGLVVIKLTSLILAAWLLTMIPILLGNTGHTWQRFTGLINAQPVRLGCYFSAFAVGIYFYTLHRELSFGRVILAALVALILSFVIFKLVVSGLYAAGFNDLRRASFVAGARVIRCFGFLFLIVFVFWQFLNIDFRWLRPLHSLTYGIYLMHLVLVVLLQWLFLLVDWPVGWEVLAITVGSFGLSALCTYGKQRYQTGFWLAVKKPGPA